MQWRSSDETFADAAIDHREATVSSGTTTRHTITGLTNGTTYTVRVLATKTGAGDGAPSVEVSGTPAAVPPGRVTEVSLTTGNTQLTVKWTAVSDATGYKVQWRSSVTKRLPTTPSFRTGTTTRYTITGLTNGTTYTVRVLATEDRCERRSPLRRGERYAGSDAARTGDGSEPHDGQHAIDGEVDCGQ